MRDFERELALSAIRIAYQLDGDLNDGKKKTGIGLVVMTKARHAAADALAGLIHVDPEDAAGIRHLQNEVKRYCDMVPWLQRVLSDGAEAAASIADEDKAAVSNDISWRNTDDDPEQFGD